MLRTATRRAMLYPAAAAASDWWAWLNARYTVAGAYDFRSAASLADATKIGSTPSIVQQPGGGLNITAAGLVCADDTILDSGIVPSIGTESMIALFSGVSFISTTKNVLAGSLVVGDDDRFYIWPANSSTTRRYGHGIFYDRSGIVSSGTMAIAGTQPYLNGAADGAAFSARNMSTLSIFIGGQNVSLGSNFYYELDGTIAALAITSDTISEADMATLHTLMSA